MDTKELWDIETNSDKIFDLFELDDGFVFISNKFEIMLIIIKENNYEIIESIPKQFERIIQLSSNKFL